MIVTSLIFGQKNADKMRKESKPQLSVDSSLPQKNYISHVPRPYIADLHSEPAFGGIKFNKMIAGVKGKTSMGAGIFTPDGKWTDFSKIGEGLLEDLDVTKATDQEIYASWHSNALRESQHPWTAQYNKNNMDKMPATYPSINDPDAEDQFRANRARLWDFTKNHSLDVPITDDKGNLTLDCIVFDTETTGINIDASNIKSKKPLDKIVQVGAMQVKGGKVIAESAINQLINPEMPIPEGATKVHGITDFMVRNSPTIGGFLRSFTQDYMHKKNGVIAIYNAKFDRTILNNAIRRYNTAVSPNEQIKERQAHKILDPFILLQRIHPYMGVRKRLGDQYQYLFCKKMQGAHDALADVTGTVDALKYSLYWLSEHRKDKSRPLMLREVLAFQNGENKIKNLNFNMDSEGCNADVNFDMSERYLSVPVVNHPRNYHLTKTDLEDLAPQIGSANVAKLQKSRTRKEKFVPMEYKKADNFIKVLSFAKMEPFGGKSVDEIHTLIKNESFRTTNEQAINIWMKNPNPADIPKGNDLPDIKIVRRVMQEAKERQEPVVLPDTIKFETTPGANAKKRKAPDQDDD